MSKKIFLCAISNISSGHCLEDCKFCTQSVKYAAAIERFYHKPIEKIVQEAKAARDRFAVGFCLVTAGKGLDEKSLRFVCEAAEAVKREVPELNIIACNGTASYEQLTTLKNSGVGSYNHNLETSESFYPQICSTHSWRERYETCENVKKAGLNLCTGGIFGLGESLEDRVSMLEAVASLEPASVPINFYHSNEALPLRGETLPIEEALGMIKTAREILPKQRIMVAGGREVTFGSRDSEIFAAGANAIVIGDYLTTSGTDPLRDHRMIEEAGYEIAKECNEH
ncbi:MAG: biotin synthase [Hydrogenimonas sp.]|nr:biotin synthase [Hydrogenimonas sp.]